MRITALLGGLSLFTDKRQTCREAGTQSQESLRFGRSSDHRSEARMLSASRTEWLPQYQPRSFSSKHIIVIGLLLLMGSYASARAATIAVSAGGDLQAALDAANCGDQIIVQAGASYSGNFVLRYKGPCSGTDADYITIRTSDLAGIPAPGTRITNQFGLAMPKLVANTPAPALEAEANAHHYRLIGVELTNIGGVTFTPELVLLGARSSGGGIPFVNHPHHITFDRCWIHEATNDSFTPDGTVTTADRGMNVNATDITITESRIAGFRTFLSGNNVDVQASNAILFPNSARRVTVSNSYLEAWFVPIFFGGSSGESPNVAALTDVIFDSINHRGSARFSTVQNLSVSDLVAFKTTGGRTPVTNSSHPNEPIVFQVGKVTNIAGSIVSFASWGSFDGNLAGGNPLLQAPDSPGQAQWNGYQNQDITISRNTIMLNFNSTEQVWVQKGGSPTTQPRSTQTSTGSSPKGFMEFKMAKNVTIDGNIFDGWMCSITLSARNQGNSLTSGGFPWSGLFNINITNNWFKRVVNWDRIYSSPIGGPLLQDNEFSNLRSGPILIQNNLFEMGVEEILSSLASADNVSVIHNTYPGSPAPLGGKSLVFAHSSSSSKLVLTDNIISNNEYGMNCQIPGGGCLPGLSMNGNVIIDNRSSAAKTSDSPLTTLYSNNRIASTQASVVWTDPQHANYRLSANSPYRGTASDGTDPGVDMDRLLAAIGGTQQAPTPSPTPSPTPGPTVTPTPAPTPMPNPGAEIIWVDDALPAGAVGSGMGEGWNWLSSNPSPISGSFNHPSAIVEGVHQHLFTGATDTLTINAGDILVAYIYIDPANVPNEVMLQWLDTNWAHRAYWGSNRIDWGTMHYMGPLPAVGQWVRLEVAASQVGLEGKTINGMAFTLYGGRATWDRSGKAAAVAPSPTPTPVPTPSISPSPLPSPTPTPVPPMKSPSSVLIAKNHATSLVDQMDASNNHATKPGPGTIFAALLATNLDGVTNDILRASDEFVVERNLFGAAGDEINTHLSAALMFARANAALVQKTGDSSSVRMHLQRIVSHLAMTEDLMLRGRISAMTANQARAVMALTNLVIGIAGTGGVGQALGIAPASMSSLFSNSEQPFGSQTVFAPSVAGSGLPYELGGISIIVAGQAAALVYVSPARLTFVVPSDIPVGGAEIIVTSQDGHVARGTTIIPRSVFRVVTHSGDGLGPAIVINQSVGGLDVVTKENFGPDKRTRLIIFGTGITASAANSDPSNDIQLGGGRVANLAESVAVEVRTSNGQIVSLPVEFAGSQPALLGLDQANVILNPELRGAGTVELTLIIGSLRSNAATVVIR